MKLNESVDRKYYQKYLKYKTKYLLLKQQKGGNGLSSASHNLFMDFIDNITVYISDDIWDEPTFTKIIEYFNSDKFVNESNKKILYLRNVIYPIIVLCQIYGDPFFKLIMEMYDINNNYTLNDVVQIISKQFCSNERFMYLQNMQSNEISTKDSIEKLINEKKISIEHKPETQNNDLYIFTSGLGNIKKKEEWIMYIYPWLLSLNKNLYIVHYDMFTDEKAKGIIGRKINKYLNFDDRYKNKSPDIKTTQENSINFDDLIKTKSNNYVYFDMGHALNYETELPYKCVHYPYDENNYFQYFKPFRFENTDVITYIEDLKKEQNIIEIDLVLQCNGEKIILGTVKTFEVNNLKFDTQDKLTLLFNIISYFKLSKLVKDLELKNLIKPFDEINRKHKFCLDGTPFKKALDEFRWYY